MAQIVCLSHKEAWDLVKIAHGLLEDGKKSANICVVTRQGQVLLHAAMDEACPATMNIALLKAQQSASVGRRTRWIRDLILAKEATKGLFDIDPEKYVPWAGGVPIYSKEGILLGAMGISNLTEDEDEKFCLLSIEKADYISEKPE